MTKPSDAGPCSKDGESLRDKPAEKPEPAIPEPQPAPLATPAPKNKTKGA